MNLEGYTPPQKDKDDFQAALARFEQTCATKPRRPEQEFSAPQERYGNFSFTEDSESVPVHKIYILNKNGWSFSATIDDNDPATIVVKLDIQNHDSATDENQRMLCEAKAQFSLFVADNYGFWSTPEASRLEEARKIADERHDYLEE